MKANSTPSTSLLSVYDISKITGHAPTSIYQAIQRMNLEPSLITRSGNFYYGEEIIEQLKELMQKPRRKQK